MKRYYYAGSIKVAMRTGSNDPLSYDAETRTYTVQVTRTKNVLPVYTRVEALE